MLTLYLQHIFKFLCTNIHFKNEKKVVGYRLGYSINISERCWSVMGKAF